MTCTQPELDKMPPPARGNRTRKSKHTGTSTLGCGAVSKHARNLPSTKGLSKKAKKLAATAAAWALVATCEQGFSTKAVPKKLSEVKHGKQVKHFN